MSDDNIVIICSTHNSANTKGRQDKCAKCSAVVWLSYSSMEAVYENSKPGLPITILCMECGLEQMKKLPEGEAKILAATSKQVREMITAINKDHNK